MTVGPSSESGSEVEWQATFVYPDGSEVSPLVTTQVAGTQVKVKAAWPTESKARLRAR